MGFDEVCRGHEVRILETQGDGIVSRGVNVPVFQRLERVGGDIAEIESRLDELSASGESVWVEVLYTGSSMISDLRRRVEEHVSGAVEVLRIRNARLLPEGMDADPEQDDLEELGVEAVFERRLQEAFPDAAPDDPALKELRATFREAAAAALFDEEDSSCAS